MTEENGDPFSSALRHLLGVHRAQIQALNEQLEEERRGRRELEGQVESLQKANDEARKIVVLAKKKIKHQEKVIGKVKEQQGSSDQDELTAISDGDLTTTVVQDPLKPTSETAAHKLNQTCATLFESPAPGTIDRSKVIAHETPGRPYLVQTEPEGVRDEAVLTANEGRGFETEEPVDYHRGESVETVADHDVIILDDVKDNANPTHSSSKAAVSPPPQTRNGSQDIRSSLPPSGPVHVVYSHAHDYGSLEERNIIMSPSQRRNQSSNSSGGNRPLSLRDGGSGKIKWKEVSSSLASSGTLSETRLSLSPEKLVSPQCESGSTSASSSPEVSSPSLLGSSSSPWKDQHSSSASKQHSSSTPVYMTQSLFAKTPAVGQSVTVGVGSVAVTTPVSMLKSAIPHSDSQLSFDVSQSAPLSPELCPPTNHLHKRKRKQIMKASIVEPSSGIAANSPLSADPSVVPITPGVPSVNKILMGQKGWMTGRGRLAKMTTAADKLSSLRSGSGKRGQDQVEFEDEDILPPKSKVHKHASMQDTAASFVDDDQTRIEEMEDASPSPDEEDSGDAMSPVLTCSSAGRAATKVGNVAQSKEMTGTTTSNAPSPGPQPLQLKHDQQRLMKKAGLPTSYKYDAKILRRADRDKLDGKACPDCKAWFDKDDGIHGDVESHLRCTCRHKYLHRPPDEESDLWNISFPATEECNDIMDRK